MTLDDALETVEMASALWAMIVIALVLRGENPWWLLCWLIPGALRIWRKQLAKRN
jgi:hypothetical protein